MGTPKPRQRQFLDSVAGARVGGFGGALLGAIVAAVLGIGYAWLIFVGCALGAAAGYWAQKHRSDPS